MQRVIVRAVALGLVTGALRAQPVVAAFERFQDHIAGIGITRPDREKIHEPPQ